MNASANSPLDDLRAKLTEVRSQASKLEEEIARLEKRGQLELPSAPAVHKSPQSPAEKVALFLDLFGTRRSVFPKRWENAKTGKSGYAPACDNEWRPGVCRKPQIKCTECPHQKFPPLDADAIETHLRGIHTLGVYAITQNITFFRAGGASSAGPMPADAHTTATLPTSECAHAQRDAHVFVRSGHPASLADLCDHFVASVNASDNESFSRVLSSLVTSWRKDEMAARAGIEPATK